MNKKEQFRKDAFTKVADLVMEAKPELNAIRLIDNMLEMEKIHGEDCIADLYGWYLWAKNHGKEEGYIWTSIWHDLTGYKDKFMSPRTSGYMEAYLNEIEDKSIV
jgi:hypothetical protein